MTQLHAPSIPIRLILPAPAGDGATCLHVDAEGRIRDRHTLTPQQSDSQQSSNAGAVRNVLALPGSEVRSLWLELPARSEVQAVAAARLMLDDRLAGAGQDLPRSDPHVVVAPKTDDAELRQVLIVESATLQARLDQARRLGFEADIALPDYMLLPSPGPDDPPCVAVREGQWLVRGDRLAFTCERALAECVVGNALPAPIDDSAVVETRLAHGALQSPLNLLQHRFARSSERPDGRGAWHRAAILAGLLLLSPLLLTAADAARYAIAAAGLRAEARDIARDLAGTSIDDEAPTQALHAALARESSGDAFPRLAGRLFHAIAELPDMQMEQLDYDGGDSVRAALSHDTPEAIDTLRRRLAGDGLRLETSGTDAASGDGASTVIVTDASSMEDAP